MKGSLEFSFDDYRNGTPPRAFGNEIEFTDNGNLGEAYAAYEEYGAKKPPVLEQFVDSRYRIDQYCQPMNICRAVITTGGKLYVDMGVLEYAGPECRTPAELAAHARGGEVIATDTLERMAVDQEVSDIKIFMRSGNAKVTRFDETLIKEGSIGNHENYSSLSEFSTYPSVLQSQYYNRSVQAECFADFLALRKIIDGIGMVDEDGFSISQRPRAVDFRKFDNCTTHGKKRPFYQKGGRLEVRTGEANKSDWATEFKVGLTSLVLRLIEHEKFPQRLRLSDPNQAVRSLSSDPLDYVVMENGLVREGAEVLKEIVDAAVDLCQSSPDWPVYEQKAAKDFYDFYRDLHLVNLRDNEVSTLADRIDWAARFAYFIQRGATYKTFTSSDLAQVRDDLKWDQLNDRNIARRYFSRFGHTVLNAAVPKAPHTRATPRVEISRQLSQDNRLHYASWDKVTATDGRNFTLGGPLSFEVTSPYA